MKDAGHGVISVTFLRYSSGTSPAPDSRGDQSGRIRFFSFLQWGRL